jgi:putative aldouronate transport system permease protein
MRLKRTAGEKCFTVVNAIIITVAAISCLLPFLNVLAISLSSNAMASGGAVTIWPKDFTTNSYQYLLTKSSFWTAFLVSLKRVAIGVSLNMFLTIIFAYPLSKPTEKFPSRTAYVWYFFFTVLLSGGLMPTYALMNSIGLMDTIWALVLPSTVPVFNIVLLLNFYRTIPSEMEDAALIDGAGHFRTLFQVFVPCSLPALATLTLFCTVGHWNAWFDGLIYMNTPENYPLQSYLQTVIIDMQSAAAASQNYDLIKELSDRTLKSAQIIIATVPILAVYPFLQRYFITGLTLGSVKG